MVWVVFRIHVLKLTVPRTALDSMALDCELHGLPLWGHPPAQNAPLRLAHHLLVAQAADRLKPDHTRNGAVWRDWVLSGHITSPPRPPKLKG